MKPIFKSEKDFLEKHMHIQLPEYCWRKGMSIYLNPDTKPAIIKFEVKNKKIIIKKNNIEEVLKSNKNKTWQEEIELNKNRLLLLEKESIEKTKDYILQYPNNKIRVGVSGGKDSDLMWYILQKVFADLHITDYIIDFYNTTNDTAQTYLHVKNDYNKEKLQINNPQKGWHKWIQEDKNYFLPSVLIRNCCSTYKEGQIKKVLDKNENYIIFLGARKHESSKRSDYDWDLNNAEKSTKNNVPANWKRFLPIVEWTDADVWLYILWKQIKYNEMYNMGFNRCGCLICPYQSDYIDLITKDNYPKQWDRWMKIVEKNYEVCSVGSNMKWTLEEWQNGMWKQGKSKEQFLIYLKPTKTNVKALADIKGISEELAIKYFERKCQCGKKLNPDEVAMNLKVYGRDIGLDKMECKNCFCEKNNLSGKEYVNMIYEFRNSGCKLF